MKKHLIVTSISAPNPVLRALAEGAIGHGFQFTVVGDTKSPEHFEIEGVDFLAIKAQRKLPFRLTGLLRERSYARKNLGYLRALQDGADFILETDDDNFPRSGFWNTPEREVRGSLVSHEGWSNVYSYFSRETIWPRGFPLEFLAEQAPVTGPETIAHCPIQQGLADENPDVDAVYRMTRPLPINFDHREPVILGRQTWCPFNSQNTIHFPEAYLLMYLPTYCSFRMTDIWRSFVAQRVLWTCGWNLSFHHATVWQERNAHNLLNDFTDEVPGYLNNARIIETLSKLDLAEGPEAMAENLVRCYRSLVELGVVGEQEIPLVEAWIADCGAMRTPNTP